MSQRGVMGGNVRRNRLRWKSRTLCIPRRLCYPLSTTVAAPFPFQSTTTTWGGMKIASESESAGAVHKMYHA